VVITFVIVADSFICLRGRDCNIVLLHMTYQVLINDFFLVACLDDFIENARLFIFETFCRIHQCISIRFRLVCNMITYL